jgi:hypothetical protein
MLVFLAVLSIGTASAADITEGLVAHWTLDSVESGSLTAAGATHIGTVQGAAGGEEGRSGKSLLFACSEDDFVDLGTSLQLSDVQQATFAAVVKARSYNPPDAKNRANSRNGILGSDDANLIFALTDRGRPTLVWDAGENEYQSIVADPTDAIPVGHWAHVAVTRDGSTMTIYVNGRAVKTEQRYSPGNFVRLNRTCLGRVNGTPNRDFDGWIDDVRVYRRALTAEEIRQLAEHCQLAGVEFPRPPFGSRGLERVLYNQPGLAVDLGVGLWAQPLPMDYDSDGDMDLVVSCADVPYNGTYFFENPGGAKLPVFKPAVRIDRGLRNAQVSHVDGKTFVLTPGLEYHNVANRGFSDSRKLDLPTNIHPNKVRANQWKYADFDGDGQRDLLVGVGDWTEYGWDNAFNAQGQWTNGPLRGFVYLLRNNGTTEQPDYAPPTKLLAEGKALEVYGMPSPNLEDFDDDGDLDLLCGEFVDTLTYFQNLGTRTEPQFAAGRKVEIHGEAFHADLCMIIPVAVDWEGDGDPDIVLGQEDGRVMFLEHTGKTMAGMPQFSPPQFFQQEAEAVKFGALVTPVGVDWDADGDDDLVCGNTAGRVAFVENLGGFPPRWAPPECLQADGQIIQIMAGPNGSIQGPCETKWGYTTLSVADWDHDGLPDLVVNSIWGRVVWYRNVGTREAPRLTAAAPVEVQWPERPPQPAWNWWEPKGNELATQWRTTPVVVDLNQDGLNDLMMLDHEGYLAFFARTRTDDGLKLLPPERIFFDAHQGAYGHAHQAQGKAEGPLRLNTGEAGRSGRRKLCVVDWDRDGTLDLLANSRNINFLRGQAGDAGRIIYRDMGLVDTRILAGHTTSPTTVDWDSNGVPDLVVGAEDGFLYYLRNPHQ